MLGTSPKQTKKEINIMTYNRSTQFSPRRSGNWNRNQNTVAFASTVKLGPVTHTVLVALMITVLGLIYLTQATRATSYDYEAQKIDSQIAELSDQKTDLEVENARLTAIDNVRSSSVAKAMTQPSETHYTSE
jgi:cell division protein FtsL